MDRAYTSPTGQQGLTDLARGNQVAQGAGGHQVVRGHHRVARGHRLEEGQIAK